MGIHAALQMAAQSGVDVRILVPGKSDARFTEWASRSYLREATDAGIKVSLYEKGFLDFHKVDGQGKTHRYVPLVTRAEYTRRTMQEVKRNLFGGSVKSMLSFFVQEEDLSPDEVRELLRLMQNAE